MATIEGAHPIADGAILGAAGHHQGTETLPGEPTAAIGGNITDPSPEGHNASQPAVQEGPSPKVSQAGAVGARAPNSCHRSGSGSSRGSSSSATGYQSCRKSKAYLILSPITMAHQDEGGVGFRLSQVLNSIRQAFRRARGGGDKKPAVISGDGGETTITSVEAPPLRDATVVDSDSKHNVAQDKASVGGCIKALTSGLTKAGGGGGSGTANASSMVSGASSVTTTITTPPLSSTANTQQDIDPAAISIGGLINAAEVGFSRKAEHWIYVL